MYIDVGVKLFKCKTWRFSIDDGIWRICFSIPSNFISICTTGVLAQLFYKCQVYMCQAMGLLADIF